MLGATFGGALCLYFAAGHRKTGLIAVGVVLFALTLMKEIGLAYAVIVVGCIFLDKIFACDGAFWRGFGKRLLNAFACACNLALPFLVGYFAWTKYVLATTGVDKAVVGSETSGTAVSYGFVLVDGVLQLLGMGDASYAEKFADVQGKMLAAFTEIDVCLLGGGALAIALILAVLAVAIFTAQKGAPRRRAVMFTVANTCAFVVFVVFHLFLYVYNFAANEAAALKDYDRYITPYYLGWLLAALCLLCAVTGEGKKAAFARLAQVCVCVAICAAVCLWGVPSSGFWNESNMNYAERLDVQSRAAIANEVLDWEDEVFIISQGDDATRWYYYTYELNATVAFGYAGGAYTEEGARYWLTTASSLIEPDTKSAYTYTAQCAQEDLVAFLRDMGYTHVLVDESDEYVYAEFGALFDEALPETWESGVVVLYEIVDDGTTMQFVRVAGGQYETVE